MEAQRENHVFISYRRSENSPLAYLLYDKLQEIGYDVLYDVKSLTNGKFLQEIEKIIDSCSDVIVLLSSTSLIRDDAENDVFRHEIRYSMEQGKNIIPVFTDEMNQNDGCSDVQELFDYNGCKVNFSDFNTFRNELEKKLTCRNTHEKPADTHKNVYMWSDCGGHNRSAIAALGKLKKSLNLGENYSIVPIDAPQELLFRNISKKDIIVMLVTDVTKFSENSITTQKINQMLKTHVINGGKLIGSHDIIYRRVRNEKLQEIAGCQIERFEVTEDKVKYIKNIPCCKEKGLFLEIEDEFELDDGEINWSEHYSPDIDVYFETIDGKPLLFSREYGDGVFIWMNSGDYKKYPPTSIIKPEKNFIALLRELILFEF